MQRKSKINTVIRCTLFLIIAVLFVLTYFKLKNIEQSLWKESSSLINITPTEKNIDLRAIQDEFLNTIEIQKGSTAAVMKKKKIKVVWEDWEEESEIETTKSQEWNAIVITTDWYLLTNKHVVEDKQWIYSVIIENKEYSVDKIRNDEELDLSIIKIKADKKLTAAKIPSINTEIKIWNIVFAIKNDIESNEYWTKMWIINSKNQKLKQKNWNIYIWMIKSSTAIEAGFSWWPLIDINWNTIWINTAIDNIEYGASYTLPINQELISESLNSIKQNNKIIRPSIEIEYEQNDKWIKVTKIQEWSNAEKAWLKEWDVIIWINDFPVDYNNFLYVLYSYNAWKSVVLNIQQWELKNDIQVTLSNKQ